jgi:hypothetical protein
MMNTWLTRRGPEPGIARDDRSGNSSGCSCLHKFGLAFAHERIGLTAAAAVRASTI